MMYFVLSLKWSVLIILLISSFGPEKTCTEEASKLGYCLQLYNSINSYRTKHTIRMLGWNRTLVETAELMAARIAKGPNTFDRESLGINLFFSLGTIRPPVSIVTGSWYNESFYYDYSNPKYNPSTLNFTAMIWKSSISVGIGLYTSSNRTTIVAKFYPEGNIRGEFRENVMPVYEDWSTFIKQ